jgi:hypothetical protein
MHNAASSLGAAIAKSLGGAIATLVGYQSARDAGSLDEADLVLYERAEETLASQGVRAVTAAWLAWVKAGRPSREPHRTFSKAMLPGERSLGRFKSDRTETGRSEKRS